MSTAYIVVAVWDNGYDSNESIVRGFSLEKQAEEWADRLNEWNEHAESDDECPFEPEEEADYKTFYEVREIEFSYV